MNLIRNLLLTGLWVALCAQKAHAQSAEKDAQQLLELRGRKLSQTPDGFLNPKPARQTQPCVVVLCDKQYLDRHEEEQPIECELRGDADINGRGSRIVRVINLPPGLNQQGWYQSGVTTIFHADAEIDDSLNQLTFPNYTDVTVSSSPRRV